MNKKKPTLEKIEELLIQLGLKIAKKEEGALFVVGNVKYKTLIKQQIKPFYINENIKLLEKLATIDGAIIIGFDGKVKAYGAMIKNKKVFRGHGTRHSAAVSAAEGKNIVILVSEEDKKVKIIKEGKMVMQIDALQKNVEKSVHEAVTFLESIGAGTLGAIGTSMLVPGLGITLLPGIVLFGSAYYLSKILIISRFQKKKIKLLKNYKN